MISKSWLVYFADKNESLMWDSAGSKVETDQLGSLTMGQQKKMTLRNHPSPNL